jgi:hypothetical protein
MHSLAGSTALAAGVPLAEWCENDQVAIMKVWARDKARSVFAPPALRDLTLRSVTLVAQRGTA